MKTLLALMILASLMSCVQNNAHSYLQLGGIKKRELIRLDCRGIEAHGNIKQHLDIISQSTEEVLSLLESKNPLLYQQRISELAEIVKMKASLVHELSRVEWTDAKWFTRLGWSFFPDPRPGNWLIENIQVENVYLMGDKRDDLVAKVEFWEKHGWIYVNLERYASSLEICQLQKTMMVVLKVTLTSGKKERTYFYNLYFNPTPGGEL